MKFALRWSVVFYILIIAGGLGLALFYAPGPVEAGNATMQNSPAQIAASNYCVSCHLAEDPRLAGASSWHGGIEAVQNSPCPALLTIQEELFYTEQIMLATDRLQESLPDGAVSTRLDGEILARQQGYSRLLDMPTASLGAFTAEAQTLRFRMGKNYAALNAVLENIKRGRVLAGAAAATLVVLVALLTGLRNTQKGRPVNGSHASRRLALRWPRRNAVAPGILLLSIFAFFALPIFRVPAAETVTPTEAEQAVQTALDTSGRVADTADRAFGRAWILAKVGAAWNASDPDQAAAILDEALAANREAQLEAQALWGQAQTAREASAGSSINQEKASLIAARLEATQARAWGLQRMAVEWSNVDPEQAQAILEEAYSAAAEEQGAYADLDVRLIAALWAGFDARQAVKVAGEVRDPAVRAWGYRELATITGDENLFQLAAEAARQVSDPIESARLLRALGAASADASLFQEALVRLEDAPETAARAYALAELAGAAGSADLINNIGPEYAEARALGYYRLGMFEKSWKETEGISSPYERGRAQAAVASAWGNAPAAETISVPLFRDLALRDLVVQGGEASLVEKITSPYYRVQALTALGKYPEAWEEAQDLGEPFPLVRLASAWASSNPEQALQIVEALEREVDKAEALRAITAATGQEEHFQRALGMALAARLRGDALHPVEASLALAEAVARQNAAWAQAAFQQAWETAQRISIK